jgi:hypothetical protein
MGRRHRVPLHGKPGATVEVEANATHGAVVGVNVWNADGTLFVPTSADPAPAGEPLLLWRLLLEVPPNITGLASMSGTGVMRRVGAGLFDTSAGLGDLADVSTAGVTEGQALLFSGGAWGPGTVNAGGAILPVVTGEINNDQPVFVYTDDGALVWTEIA